MFETGGFYLASNLSNLAPFWDENGDGLYNPMDGDYPDIKDASQAIWWVINNAGNELTTPPSASPQLEIQMMAYAYNSTVESVNNTTFYDVKFINRGLEMLDSAFVSLWVDPDLGCPSDDYVGCIPESNTAFVYNQDATDGTDGCFCPNNINTYCEAIPVLGFKILQGPMGERVIDEQGNLSNPALGMPSDTLVEVGLSSFIVYSNSISSSNSSSLTSGSAYSLMNGQWADESPLLYEGEPVNHMYSGNPADLEGWSMCSEFTSPADRRLIMNMGALRMNPGAVNQFSFCVTGVENVPHPCPDITVLKDALDEVEAFWKTSGTPTATKTLSASRQISIFPNPMQTQARIELKEADDRIQSFALYNANGQLVQLEHQLQSNTFDLNRNNLPQGIYFYKIQSQKKNQYTGKLVMQ